MTLCVSWNRTGAINPIGQTICRDIAMLPDGPALGANFTPIRGRVVSALSDRAVSGTQPTGRALPPLIIGSPYSATAYLRASCAASPVAS